MGWLEYLFNGGVGLGVGVWRTGRALRQRTAVFFEFGTGLLELLLLGMKLPESTAFGQCRRMLLKGFSDEGGKGLREGPSLSSVVESVCNGIQINATLADVLE